MTPETHFQVLGTVPKGSKMVMLSSSEESGPPGY